MRTLTFGFQARIFNGVWQAYRPKTKQWVSLKSEVDPIFIAKKIDELVDSLVAKKWQETGK